MIFSLPLNKQLSERGSCQTFPPGDDTTAPRTSHLLYTQPDEKAPKAGCVYRSNQILSFNLGIKVKWLRNPLGWPLAI